MNKRRTYNIIQYALLIAGQEDDFFDRELGPIHLIKYVYLADLNYAKYNNGETYTGIEWKFHNYGPWAGSVYKSIDPALNEICATCKSIQSDFVDDFKRWVLSNDSLMDKIGSTLPLLIRGIIETAVHKFKKDTPSLLEYVYRTEPMLKAAPGELLNFKFAIRPQKEKKSFTSKWDGLTDRKKKKFRQALSSIRENRKERQKLKKKSLVPSPIPPLDDATYFEGLDWVDSLTGEPLSECECEAHFSDNVWHSETRGGDFQ